MSVGRMEGKVAVITGGASGIGRACALRLAAEGAEIVIADLVASRCEEAAEEIRRTTNGRTLYVETNVCEENDIEALADKAMAEFGHIDCLIAAAGVSNATYVSGQSADADPDFDSSLLSMPVQDWNRVLQINLTGVMLSGRAIARRMVAEGTQGSIVNIASSAARIALPGAADYCVSKAGVEMLTRVFAMEMTEHNIRVNAIGPGFIKTPMTQNLQDTDDGVEMMTSMTPMGRLGTAEEIANTALFLACEESSYTTGQILFPNGGIFVG